MFDDGKKQVKERAMVFKSADGAELVGQLFEPAHAPFAAVVLNGATAVPQSYYAHFARWLASERGMACLTFDYRDVGRSWSGPLAQSKADMIDWGTSDHLAARQALARAIPDTPIWIIGHSLGAMMLPNQRDFEGVSRVMVIHLVLHLVARDADLLGIDHNDVVAGVHVRRVFRLVFASQASRDFGGESTEGFSIGVDHEPVAAHSFWLRRKSLH